MHWMLIDLKLVSFCAKTGAKEQSIFAQIDIIIPVDHQAKKPNKTSAETMICFTAGEKNKIIIIIIYLFICLGFNALERKTYIVGPKWIEF